MTNPMYSSEREPETPEQMSFDYLFDGSGNGLPCVANSDTDAPIRVRALSYGVSVFTPMDYMCTYSYPLLIWLHSQNGSDSELLQTMPKISLRNYIGVAPQGFTKKNTVAWPLLCLSDIETRVMDTVAQVRRQFNVNPKRIYIAGVESGGTAAMALALTRPDFFAGAATFNAPAPRLPMMFRQFKLQKNQSYFVGFPENSDTYAPVALKEDIDTFTNAGINIQFKEYKGLTLTEQMYSDVNRWIMRSVSTAVF